MPAPPTPNQVNLGNFTVPRPMADRLQQAGGSDDTRPTSGVTIKVQNLPHDPPDGRNMLAIFREAGLTAPILGQFVYRHNPTFDRYYSFVVAASATELKIIWANLDRLTFADNSAPIIHQACYSGTLQGDRPWDPADAQAVIPPDAIRPMGESAAGHYWHDSKKLAKAYARNNGPKIVRLVPRFGARRGRGASNAPPPPPGVIPHRSPSVASNRSASSTRESTSLRVQVEAEMRLQDEADRRDRESRPGPPAL